MVNFYVNKIIRGQYLWTDVPKLWNAKVQAELTKQGYTLNEDGTVTK